MFPFRKRSRPIPGPSGSSPAGAEISPAQRHYQRGNRLFESKSWYGALGEWRRAAELWRPDTRERRSLFHRLAGLRAVLGLFATVCAIYFLLLTVYPRDPFDMLMIGGGGWQDNRSWWEQFLDTGRPGMGDTHKMGVREWWERFKMRWGEDEGQELADRERFRPPIDERWADLLRRYGRWGTLVASDLDYDLVAGNGLSGLGRFEEAVSIIRQGIKETGDADRLGELYQGLANAYYFQGYRLQDDGLASYDLALVRQSAAAYEKSLRYQQRLLSLGNLGWVYFILKEYRKAESFSLRALSFDPGLHYVRLNLGLIYMVQGRLSDSYRAYRGVARRHPEAQVYLGGISDLKEVLRDLPQKHPFAHLMIGFLALQKEDRSEAMRHLEIFQAGGNVASRWRTLGRRWMENPASATEF